MREGATRARRPSRAAPRPRRRVDHRSNAGPRAHRLAHGLQKRKITATTTSRPRRICPNRPENSRRPKNYERPTEKKRRRLEDLGPRIREVPGRQDGRRPHHGTQAPRIPHTREPGPTSGLRLTDFITLCRSVKAKATQTGGWKTDTEIAYMDMIRSIKKAENPNYKEENYL